MNNEELQKEIEELKSRLDALNSYATIPLDTGNAMKVRLFPNGTIDGTTSSKSVQSRSVNESGSSSYSVALPMTGFVSITIGNVTYDIPYY